MKVIRMNSFCALRDSELASAGVVLGGSIRAPEAQDAGRRNLGTLAPEFAALNDDVLFGRVWSRIDALSPRDRSLVTIAALFSAGLFPQLKAHLEIGRAHGITKSQAVEAVTQLAFYCGWPKAWSALPIIREVYADVKDDDVPMGELSHFPLGEPNPYSQFFTGGAGLPSSTRATSAYTTSPSPRACATTGTSTTPSRAAGRSLSAWPVAATIRRTESRRGSCIRAML